MGADITILQYLTFFTMMGMYVGVVLNTHNELLGGGGGRGGGGGLCTSRIFCWEVSSSMSSLADTVENFVMKAFWYV